MKRYTCYTDLDKKIKAEGAPEGSKEDVLQWMRNRYKTLEVLDEITADWFFYDGECDGYIYADNSPIYLAEIID